ncbi:hypothetical protein [Endozoicomonas sp. 8E]|uniref:hypothetical protein n=1 Tax=Endozoicomonas sp. 8E TaxID=3035692 RepID=UPI002939518E|nr:hypothetical protein [Endozoicomonas sp. 8E]WOG26028.1 hypothetical protein P6910_15780 [Endozoicomonas sp. 8E]
MSQNSFSADGRYVLTTCKDGTAKIHGMELDGSWVEKAIICHDDPIVSATFSTNGLYVVTSFSKHVIVSKLLMHH